MAKLRTVDQIRQHRDLVPLNVPKPAQVRYVGRGEELRITHLHTASGWVACEQRDRWRVDTNWWREERSERHYFEVQLTDYRRVVVFWDAVGKAWFTQRYTAPLPVHHIEPPAYPEE